MSLIGVVVSLLLVVSVSSLVPIPRREVGFVYKSASPMSPIHLDIFIDHLCPYSKRALPIVVQVADHYGLSTLRLTTHLFPLPYHRNSFYASKGTHIVDELTSGNKTYEWISTVFNKIPTFSQNATKNLADEKIVGLFAELANKTVGVPSSHFISMFHKTRDIEMDTRVDWKYGCSRGVSQVPTFMVNDVFMSADSSWNLTDWRNVIDPLL